MSCNCKHMQEEIKEGYKVIAELRELFIKRMTVDSETHDRRRSDYNEAIFDEHYKPKPDVSLGSVLKCFNNAVKDWRKTFCDSDKCRERKVPKENKKISEKAIFKTAKRLEDWGKWERFVWSRWEYAKCPFCGITANNPTNYCPQCGKDMRKEDVVHVVRCKDCKWQPERVYGIRGAECNQLWCVCFNTWVPMDHYCSKGERKDTQ